MHNGKEYTGLLTPVMLAGGSAIFHLMLNKYYWGRLRYAEFKHLAAAFKKAIAARRHKHRY
jgi:hypothetical protein